MVPSISGAAATSDGLSSRMLAGAPWFVMIALRRRNRMIESGPVLDPPSPDTPKLWVPILRSFAKVRKVSWMLTLPAFNCSAMGSAVRCRR
jgi:hypothetical protein